MLTSCLGPSAEENRGEEGVVCIGEMYQNKPVISKPGLSFLLWGLGRTVQFSLAGYTSEGVGVTIPATLHRLSQLRTLRPKGRETALCTKATLNLGDKDLLVLLLGRSSTSDYMPSFFLGGFQARRGGGLGGCF